MKMKFKNLWILVGIPGSGKSTLLKQNSLPNSVTVSRDQIRFNRLKDGESYFSHEDEVFDAYIQTIQYFLDSNMDPYLINIYADATHLNYKSRNKLLSNLKLRDDIHIHAIYFNIPLETCIRNNEKREGRAKVPETAIRNMYKSLTNPQLDICQYETITIINNFTLIEDRITQHPSSDCDKCVWYLTGCEGKEWNYELCPSGMKFQRDPPDGGFYG